MHIVFGFSNFTAEGHFLGEGCDWILYYHVKEKKIMDIDDALWDWVHLLSEEKQNEVYRIFFSG